MKQSPPSPAPRRLAGMPARAASILAAVALATLATLSAVWAAAETPASAAPPDDEPIPYVTRAGEELREQGQPWRATGFYIPDAAMGPAARACRVAGNLPGLRAFHTWALSRALRAGGGVVKVAAYQSAFGPDASDLAALDELVGNARHQGLRVILALDAHDDPCAAPAAGPRDLPWYGGGYRSPDADRPVGLLQHARNLASRYAREPTVLGYVMVDGAAVLDDGGALRALHSEVARVLKLFAPAQLVISGAQPPAGPVDRAMAWVNANRSASIDVLQVTDLDEEAEPYPLSVRRAATGARALGRPLMVAGGILPGRNSHRARAQMMVDKMAQAEAMGVPLYIVWSLAGRGEHPAAAYDIGVHPPLTTSLQYIGLERFAAVGGCGADEECHRLNLAAPEPIAGF